MAWDLELAKISGLASMEPDELYTSVQDMLNYMGGLDYELVSAQYVTNDEATGQPFQEWWLFFKKPVP